MTKKKIAAILTSLILSCFAVLVLSSCSLFYDAQNSPFVVSQKDMAKFMRSVKFHRGDAESHYRLGCYLQKRHEHRLAVEEFKTAVEIDPKDVKAYNGLGVSYDSMGNYAQAIESYKAALKVDQKLDYVLNNLGYSYYLKGDLGKAIDSFQKAIALDHKNKRYHNNLGLAFAKSKKYDQAFSEFELAGTEATANYNIAQFLYRDGLYEEARSRLARAFALDPQKRSVRSLKAAESLAKILAADKKERKKEEPLYTVLAGSFNKPANAERRAVELIKKGYKARVRKNGKEGPLYTVHIGLFAKRKEAVKSAVKLKESEGINTLAVPAKYPVKIEPVNGKNEATHSVPEIRDREIQKPVSNKIEIEVSNGNGVNRMARNVGVYLSSKGFKTIRVTNAKHFHYQTTTIYYLDGYLQAAFKIAQDIPGWQDLEKAAGFDKKNIDIRVLIGKDVVPYLAEFEKG